MASVEDRPVVSGPIERPTGPFYAPVASGLPITVFTFAFALAMLSLSNAQIYTPKAAGLWVPIAIVCGAGNLIGGLWSFRANDLFVATFAIGYGLLLVSMGFIVGYFAPGVIAAAGAAGFGDALGSWLFLWAIFSLVFAYGAYYVNAPAFIALGGVFVILVLLGLANVGPASLAVPLTQIGGWLGLLTAADALYLAAALILNPTVGRDVLPIPLMRSPRA